MVFPARSRNFDTPRLYSPQVFEIWTCSGFGSVTSETGRRIDRRVEYYSITERGGGMLKGINLK